MLPNLGRGFDIGVQTPSKIEVKIGAGLAYSGSTLYVDGSTIGVMAALSPDPSLAYSSGVGGPVNLVNIVTTLVNQTPYSLAYMITADWTSAAGAQTILSITNVTPSKLYGISFGMARNTDNRTPAEIAVRGQGTLVFRNTFSGAGGNPMKITVFLSVAP